MLNLKRNATTDLMYAISCILNERRSSEITDNNFSLVSGIFAEEL